MTRLKLSYLVLFFACMSCVSKVDYYNLPTYSKNNNVNAVIEIPAGTNKKLEFNTKSLTFEIDKKKGKDRVIEFLPYIGNYGFIPSTYSDPNKGGDGDAVDVLVIAETVDTGTVLEITPIGLLKLIDDGEIDYKVIANVHDKSKQIIKANSFKDLESNYPEIIKIIESWFLNYNIDDEAKINGWGNEKEAYLEINKNIQK